MIIKNLHILIFCLLIKSDKMLYFEPISQLKTLHKINVSEKKDLPHPKKYLKKALTEYQKILELTNRYEYNTIENLSWETIDILKQNDKTYEALNYAYYKCNALFMLGKEEDALKALKILIKKFEGKTNDCTYADLLKLKAVIYQRLNFYRLALIDLEMASIFLRNNTKCTEIQIAIETEKSYLFDIIHQAEKSLMAAKKALNLSKEKIHISSSHGAVGRAYLMLKKPKKAYTHITQALKLVDKNDTYQTNYYKCLMIETYFKLNKHKNLDSLFLYLDDTYIEYHKYLFYRFKAKSLVARNQYKEALYYFEKAKQQIPELHLITERILLKEISEVLQLMGNYKESNKHLVQYLNLENTFTIEEKTNRISEQTVLLELSEKEAALQKSKRKSLEQELVLYKKNKTITIGFIILVTLLILVWSLFYFNKINKRKNKELEIEKRIVNKTNEVLNKTLGENKLLLKEIHHRVKNNLQIIISLLNIQAKNDKKIKMDDFIDKAQSRISSMSLIHQSLYESDKIDSIDFEEYIIQLTNKIKHIYGVENQNIQIEIRVKNIFFDIQTAIPLGLILNELLSNTFKYAFTNYDNAKIKIQIDKLENNQFILTFADNGKGFITNRNKQKSLGLELISLLALQLKGKIEKQNEIGTQYKIIFKVMEY